MSILNIMGSFGVKVPLIHSFPLDSLGFNWIVPVLIASVIGFFVKSKGSNAKSDSNEVTA